MGLKKIRGWSVIDDYHIKTADGKATICKNKVMGEDVYILWPNANAKMGQRICLGPFNSAAEAGDEYERYLEGLVKEEPAHG